MLRPGCAGQGVRDDRDDVVTPVKWQRNRDPDVQQGRQDLVGPRQLGPLRVAPRAVAAGEAQRLWRAEPLDMHAELFGGGAEDRNLVWGEMFDEELQGAADE